MNMSKKIALVTICCGSIGAGLSATVGFYYLAGVFLAFMIVLLWLISLTDSPRFASKTLVRAGMKLFITWPQNYRYYILIFKAMFNAGAVGMIIFVDLEWWQTVSFMVLWAGGTMLTALAFSGHYLVGRGAYPPGSTKAQNVNGGKS